MSFLGSLRPRQITKLPHSQAIFLLISLFRSFCSFWRVFFAGRPGQSPQNTPLNTAFTEVLPVASNVFVRHVAKTLCACPVKQTFALYSFGCELTLCFLLFVCDWLSKTKIMCAGPLRGKPGPGTIIKLGPPQSDKKNGPPK